VSSIVRAILLFTFTFTLTLVEFDKAV